MTITLFILGYLLLGVYFTNDLLDDDYSDPYEYSDTDRDIVCYVERHYFLFIPIMPIVKLFSLF